MAFKMKIILSILALAAVTMSTPITSDSNVQQIFKTGNDQFTAKLFTEVVKLQSGKSCVLSAYSVLSPLAQLALASVGPTHDEILNAIAMPNDDVTKEVFADANTRLQSIKGVEINQANKIYVRNNYALNDEFAAISKNIFKSDVQNIDFKQNQAAADEINAWVEDHTNKKIKKLVDPDTLTDETAAVLVNAVYFKGKWKIPFTLYKTYDGPFYVTKENTVTIPMMHKSSMYKYSESVELDAKFLELLYEGEETSFVIVLPNQYDGIDSLIEKMKDPTAFTKGREAMNITDVRVTLPKFKIETTTDLREVLQKMNIKKLFKRGEARLSNLIKEEANLFVSDAIQKAYMEVNEEGTEAAAANEFGVAVGASLFIDNKVYQIFNADHPFLFFLLEKNNILFNGVFRS